MSKVTEQQVIWSVTFSLETGSGEENKQEVTNLSSTAFSDSDISVSAGVNKRKPLDFRRTY